MRAVRDAIELGQSWARHPAIRGHRATAALRILRWQVAKRLGARRAQLQIGDAKFYCYPGSSAGSMLVYFGAAEWNEMTFVLRVLRPDETFVDVGANIGWYSVLAGKLARSRDIIAVEPDEQAMSHLTENLALNHLDQVRLLRAVVGAKVGEVTFTVGRDTVNRIARPDDATVRTLPMTTLDAIVGDQDVALVKIDVEGAELGVLQGAKRLLSRDRAPVLLFELNGCCEGFGVAPADFGAYLEPLGFRLFTYNADANALTLYVGAGLPEGGNVFATKDPAALEARLHERAALFPPRDVSVGVDWGGGSVRTSAGS